MTAANASHSHTSDAEVLKHKASVAKDAVVDLASETGRYASHRVSDAREVAAGYYADSKKKIASAGDTVADYVQQNPFKSIGIAIGVGFIAGLLLKRR